MPDDYDADEFADAIKYLAPRLPHDDRLGQEIEAIRLHDAHPEILTPGSVHIPDERAAKAYAAEIEEIRHKVLPSTVAAGIVADLSSVHEKIPAELRHPVPEEITDALPAPLGPPFGKSITTPLFFDPATRPIVIGLGGYQEHGKDALADILVERHGFEKFGMSDAINDILMVLDPWIEDYRDPDGIERYSDLVNRVGYTEAKKHEEVRRLLRTLGTEVGRDMIDPDIWVNMAAKKITAALHHGKSVVVTGIRNGGNEIGMILMRGGTTVWVDRPGHPVPDTTHRSENTLGPDDFEMTVSNFGTLDDLAGQADAMLGAIRSYRAAQGR